MTFAFSQIILTTWNNQKSEKLPTIPINILDEKTFRKRSQRKLLSPALTSTVMVNREELKALLSTLGVSVDDAVIDEINKIADVNGDSKIDFNKFVKAPTEWLVNNFYFFRKIFMLFFPFLYHFFFQILFYSILAPF